MLIICWFPSQLIWGNFKQSFSTETIRYPAMQTILMEDILLHTPNGQFGYLLSFTVFHKDSIF